MELIPTDWWATEADTPGLSNYICLNRHTEFQMQQHVCPECECFCVENRYWIREIDHDTDSE